MTAPDFMPVLSSGRHEAPEQGACVMEYVSIIAGENFSDMPSCTDSQTATVLWRVNDSLSDKDRHLLLPFVTRLPGVQQNTDPEFVAHVFAIIDTFGIDIKKSTDRDWINSRALSNGAAYILYAALASIEIEAIEFGKFLKSKDNLRRAMREKAIPLIKAYLDAYDENTGRKTIESFSDAEIDLIKETMFV